MRIPLSVVLVVTASLFSGCSKKSSQSAQEDFAKQFQQMMTGATLVGHSTLTNREGVSEEERYSIDRVSKIGSETWLFQTRMKLGSPKSLWEWIPIQRTDKKSPNGPSDITMHCIRSAPGALI